MQDALLLGIPSMLAVQQTGSGTAAAHSLGVSPATVIRRIESLEAAIGVRLFDRTSSGMLPTLALQRVLPWAEQIAANASALEREVSGLESQAEGVVRVALLPAFSAHLIAPSLPTLRKSHPKIVLELVPAAAMVDLVRGEADIAIRLLRPSTGDLVSRRIAHGAVGVFVSPSYLQDHSPRSFADLDWLAWDANLSMTAESRWMAKHVPNANVVLRSSDLETLLRASSAGCGAVLVDRALGGSVGLVEVPWPAPELPIESIWLVTHRALRDVPRVAAVWDWIVETAQNPSHV